MDAVFWVLAWLCLGVINAITIEPVCESVLKCVGA